VEAIVKVENRTYLVFFDFQNKTLNLVPANETAVREYGTGVIPAIVWVDENGTTECCG